jgi:hypothetical protein
MSSSALQDTTPTLEFVGNLLVGAAAIDITPDKPVPLSGQMYLRLSKAVESPITAQAVAVETRHGQQVVDQAIFVSCDLVSMPDRIIEAVRNRAKDRLAGFDIKKLVLNAIHTHSAPVMIKPGYNIPKDGIVQPEEYCEFLIDRIVRVAVKAWESRKPGLAGWGLGHAVVAQNRRAVFAGGHAQMYGNSNQPDFRGLEGFEDHSVETLCFWDSEQKLIATAVNVPCPAQEMEDNYAVCADYWHEVRKLLKAKHGDDLVVVAWIGASGDQSPHLMFRRDAEERMRQLRGLTRLQELARRIDQGWEEAYAGAVKDKRAEVILAHKVQMVDLPARHVSDKECAEAKRKIDMLSQDPNSAALLERQREGTRSRTDDPAESATKLIKWYRDVVARHERQQAGHFEPHRVELHAVRLGDVAITSNAFELFTDFGVQMKARSPAIQTFVIELAGDDVYLPSEHAVQGGGYSAVPESNSVGPEGGQVLVDRTIEMFNSMWAKPNQ